jgi:Zn-dependent protease with chaperone function
VDGAGVTHYRLPLARPLCFTLGWLQPRVYVADSLEEQLPAAELAAILAHERAHARRRDNLLGGFLNTFYTLLPIPGAHLLVRDWRRAAERACDADAASAVGSRLVVAQALVRAAALLVHTPRTLPGAARFTGDEDLEGRIAALLDPPAPERPPHLWDWGAAAMAATANPWLQHVAELLFRH